VKYKNEVMEFVSVRPHTTVRDSEQEAALAFIHYVVSLRSSSADLHMHNPSAQSIAHTPSSNLNTDSNSTSSLANTSTVESTTPTSPTIPTPTTPTPTTTTTSSSSVQSMSSSLSSFELPSEFCFTAFQDEMKMPSKSKHFEDLLGDGTLIKLKLIEGSGKTVRSRYHVQCSYFLSISSLFLFLFLTLI
jgi:hypothetical protein